jgi:hypothetical protein
MLHYVTEQVMEVLGLGYIVQRYDRPELDSSRYIIKILHMFTPIHTE